MSDRTHSSEGPECPYCFHIHEPESDWFYSKDFTDLECEVCELPFDVEVRRSTSWIGTPQF